jgi:hypothetical protein
MSLVVTRDGPASASLSYTAIPPSAMNGELTLYTVTINEVVMLGHLHDHDDDDDDASFDREAYMKNHSMIVPGTQVQMTVPVTHLSPNSLIEISALEGNKAYMVTISCSNLAGEGPQSDAIVVPPWINESQAAFMHVRIPIIIAFCLCTAMGIVVAVVAMKRRRERKHRHACMQNVNDAYFEVAFDIPG